MRPFVRRPNQFSLYSLTVLAHNLIILFTSRISIILPHVCDQIVLTIYRSVFTSSHGGFTYRVDLSHLDHRGFLIDLVANLIISFIYGAMRCCSALAISIGLH